MKTQLIVFALLAMNLTARAQTIIDWWTLDGGGGSATSANYLINDTVGQADAGRASSAKHVIVGGFWALENLGPATGLPKLEIAIAGTTSVLVWWPSPSTGFVLQQHSDAGNPAGGANVPGVPTDNGVIRSLTLPSNTSARFYRLRRP